MESLHESGDCLKELFRNIHAINELTSLLNKQSVSLREISVNAAIASGHVGQQSKVSSEIAKQIGLISTQVIQIIANTQASTSKMSARILDCIVTSAKCAKFYEALAVMQEGPNSVLLRKVCKELSGNISLQLQTAQEDSTFLVPEFHGLKQLINKIWSIVISLRVSAGVAVSGEDSFLLSIADALETMAKDTAEIISTIGPLIIKIDGSLTKRCSCTKEEPHAA